MVMAEGEKQKKSAILNTLFNTKSLNKKFKKEMKFFEKNSRKNDFIGSFSQWRR